MIYPNTQLLSVFSSSPGIYSGALSRAADSYAALAVDISYAEYIHSYRVVGRSSLSSLMKLKLPDRKKSGMKSDVR